jgi:hypothetical protein
MTRKTYRRGGYSGYPGQKIKNTQNFSALLLARAFPCAGVPGGRAGARARGRGRATRAGQRERATRTRTRDAHAHPRGRETRARAVRYLGQVADKPMVSMG